MGKVTSNIDKSRVDFFKSNKGYDLTILTETPEVPNSGIRFYAKNGRLYYLNNNGVETEIITEFTTDSNIYEVVFSYNEEFPKTVCTVSENERVINVILIVEESFNDESATISVGHTGNVNGIMSSDDNLSYVQSSYEIKPDIKYGGLDIIKLHIDSKTSTQGSGVLLLETKVIRNI